MSLFPVHDAQGNEYSRAVFTRLLTVLVVESALIVVALYAIAFLWEATH